MQLDGRVAVVTGGASGIGRALCTAFAGQGASVVVADIDAGGAQETAAAVSASGGRALAVEVDASSWADVSGLVARTEETYGPVDLFCANAGIIVAGGVDVVDEDWERMWSVNVRSHIYAARAVLPGMLARGEGYLLHTASAAGLLTQLGSAPYAVTKHAVVALAEWLSITYGDRGIRVSCLCPQAVTSNLAATSAREARRASGSAGAGAGAGAAPKPGRAWAAESRAASSAAVDGVLSAEKVADVVLEAIGEERFLILPHPEVAEYERRRAGDRERWLRGMRRLQARLGGGT